MTPEEKLAEPIIREMVETWDLTSEQVQHLRDLLRPAATAFVRMGEALRDARGTVEAFRAYYIYDNKLGGKEHENAEVQRADRTRDRLEAALAAYDALMSEEK